MPGDDIRPLSAGENRDEEDDSDTQAKCTRGEDISKKEVCSSGQLERCQSVFPATRYDGVIVIVVGVRRLSRRLGLGWYDDTGSLHRLLLINRMLTCASVDSLPSPPHPSTWMTCVLS